MTTSTPSTAASNLLAVLSTELDEASPHLRLRKEWKEASAYCDDLTERVATLAGGEELEDAVRQGEAHRDLLALARAEVDLALDAEGRVQRERLAQDENLLDALQSELKVYAGLIFATVVLPPALFAPFGEFLALGAVPAIAGFLRMRAVSEQSRGRRWLILLDRVSQVESRIRFAHAAAVGSLVLTGMWFVFSMLAERAASA